MATQPRKTTTKKVAPEQPEETDVPRNGVSEDDQVDADQTAAVAAEERARQVAEADENQKKQDEALESLQPTKIEPKVWIIGKPPEAGGTPDEYSAYTQKSLGYMQRMRFFALVSKTLGTALKEGGAGGMSDIFGGGSLSERAAELTQSDFQDASSFMSLALSLMEYTPDFLIDCYILLLEIPDGERRWARRVMEQRYDPDNNQWGLSDATGWGIIETFIEQNYEDIREFFVGKLPQLMQQVQAKEKARVDRESASGQSKQ